MLQSRALSRSLFLCHGFVLGILLLAVKRERRFNQPVMLKLLNRVLLKPLRPPDDQAELLISDYCMKCVSEQTFFYLKSRVCEALASPVFAVWKRLLLTVFDAGNTSRNEPCCVSATLCFGHMLPTLLWSKRAEYRSVFHFITWTFRWL